MQSRAFKCAMDDAKCSFYRAANAIFGKVGRLASEEVTLQLIKSKCIPVLYGFVACPLNKTQLLSLDFVMNRFLMKLFSTSNMEIISLHIAGNRLTLNCRVLFWLAIVYFWINCVTATSV